MVRSQPRRPATRASQVRPVAGGTVPSTSRTRDDTRVVHAAPSTTGDRSPTRIRPATPSVTRGASTSRLRVRHAPILPRPGSRRARQIAARPGRSRTGRHPPPDPAHRTTDLMSRTTLLHRAGFQRRHRRPHLRRPRRPRRVTRELDRLGINAPFPIQALTIEDALAGRDVCGKAPDRLRQDARVRHPVAARVGRARPPSARPGARPDPRARRPGRATSSRRSPQLREPPGRDRSTAASAYGKQRQPLRNGVDVLVACPGRLADLVRRGDVTLDDVEFVVLDEADRMADMGFLPEVKRLLDAVPQRPPDAALLRDARRRRRRPGAPLPARPGPPRAGRAGRGRRRRPRTCSGAPSAPTRRA